MKNQLKKIIHCVLITLILQSQVLSVQAAQVKFDENKKFSAVWRNNVYMITYDPNGGSGSMSSQQFKYDNDAVLAQNTYSRNGYEFLGWSTDPGATVPEYGNGQNVKNITADDNKIITLYAVWRDNVAPTVSKSFTTAGRLVMWLLIFQQRIMLGLPDIILARQTHLYHRWHGQTWHLLKI